MKKILIVAAHPDDEVLGCGGTIAKHISEGNEVHVVFMSDGVSSRNRFSDAQLQNRKTAAKLVQSLLGITSLNFLDLPDNKMDSLPLLDITKKLETIIENIKPSVVFTHHYNDLNIDHSLTNSAVMTACRPLPNSTINEIYGFEILSSTEWSNSQKGVFRPTYFVDISKHFKKKLNAVMIYEDEMKKSPHSRNIKHVEVLAQHRGNSVGVFMSEAFEVYRIIN